VHEHGGRLTVDSRPAGGTRITVDLPASPAASLNTPAFGTPLAAVKQAMLQKGTGAAATSPAPSPAIDTKASA
jgi:hypothetical protein